MPTQKSKRATVITGGKYGIDWQNSTSYSGYNLAEVRSAVIKEIRRGKEREALYWALEMVESGHAVTSSLWEDLEVFALEDVGLGDPQAILQVQATRRTYENLSARDVRRGITLSYIVCYLSRTPKTRFQTEILLNVIHERNTGESGPPIPDYAIDMHVEAGKRKGRGLKHYLTIGTLLKNEALGFPYEYRKRLLERLE